MPPRIATLLFVAGIAGLFYLDRDKAIRPSKAVWLPIIWVAINGSRSVSAWLGMGPGPEIAGQLPPVSLLDQAIAAGLMLLGVVVLLRRRKDAVAVLRASWPIVVYFSFALISLSWSDFPGWGLKRWVRALGDVTMVLVVVTDAQPAAALRRFFSRVGFVLLPVSVLLIKYYPYIGRGFEVWGDGVVNTGVTTNKNSLGILALVIALGTSWQVLELLRDKKQPNRTRRLVAQGVLLWFGIFLLYTAHSATAGVSFALGAGLMLALTRRFFRGRPQAVHALVVGLLLTAGLTVLLGGYAAAVRAMGRKPDLTGRTEIWKMVIPMCPNAIGGAGFETFWCGPRVAKFYALHGGISMTNEAHDGYVEVYLNLGLIGVGLIALILVQGYGRAVLAFRRDPVLGALLAASVVTAMAYNIGEAGFRMLDPAWFYLLLSILSANRVIGLAETVPDAARELATPPLLVHESEVADQEPSWMDTWAPSSLADTDTRL
jgi:exopolysaccharide production protein ExoQ